MEFNCYNFQVDKTTKTSSWFSIFLLKLHIIKLQVSGRDTYRSDHHHHLSPTANFSTVTMWQMLFHSVCVTVILTNCSIGGIWKAKDKAFDDLTHFHWTDKTQLAINRNQQYSLCLLLFHGYMYQSSIPQLQRPLNLDCSTAAVWQ